MNTIKTLLISVAIVFGTYLAVFLSYLLIPASIFMFVFFVVRQVRELDEEKNLC